MLRSVAVVLLGPPGTSRRWRRSPTRRRRLRRWRSVGRRPSSAWPRRRWPSLRRPRPTPTTPPAPASKMASVRNCLRMCARVAPSARRRPISLRRSITAITITLAMPIPPTSRATAPRPRNSDVNAVLAASSAASASDGRRRLDLLGRLRVHGGRQHAANGVDGAFLGADVDPLRSDVVADDVGLGCRDADDGAAIEPFGCGDGVQDADHGEPVVTDSDPQLVGDVDDPELLGGHRAEHDGRVRARCRVEPLAIGQRHVEGGQQAGVGGEHGDAAVDALRRSRRSGAPSPRPWRSSSPR